jgi:hypothetical protein
MKTAAKVYLSDIHFELNQWESELKFWEDEMKIFGRRLEEVVKRYTNNEIRAKIEHFQNQFFLHEEVIDKLKNEVKQHNKLLAGLAVQSVETVDYPYYEHHLDLRDRVDTQRKIYYELKTEYFEFLTKAL